MVARAIALCGGLAGAACLSQFPEFSQQYIQRLAGQADALQAVVADFDATAAESGLNREEALVQFAGTEFLDSHQEDMRATFARAERIEANLTVLRLSSPLERLTLPQRFDDTETLLATWDDFRPAVPLTSDGLTTGAIGFGVGWVLVYGLLALIAAPFRRRSTA